MCVKSMRGNFFSLGIHVDFAKGLNGRGGFFFNGGTGCNSPSPPSKEF